MKYHQSMYLVVLTVLFVLAGARCDGRVAAPPASVDPGELKTFFPDPETIDPAMQAEEYQEYDRDSLYDYINGGADVYLDLDFIKVGAREYVIMLEEETYFTLDVYDMSRPVNAFGIFCAEQYEDAPLIDMGVKGTLDGGSLNFWCNRFYVKIRADWEGDEVNRILKKMANHVCGHMGDPGEIPAEIALFPSKYRVPAGEEYAARNLLGVGGLKGFSCKYRNNEEELTLCFCPYAKDDEAKTALAAFTKRLRPAPKAVEGKRGFHFKDKYRGSGQFMQTGSNLAIALGLSGNAEENRWRLETIQAFFDAAEKAAMAKKKLESSDLKEDPSSK